MMVSKKKLNKALKISGITKSGNAIAYDLAVAIEPWIEQHWDPTWHPAEACSFISRAVSALFDARGDYHKSNAIPASKRRR